MIKDLISAILIASSANANFLFKAEESKPLETSTPAQTIKTKAVKTKAFKSKPSITNKDSDSVTRSWTMIGEGQTTIAGSNVYLFSEDFKLGQIVKALIPMSVMAFADGKAPVVADVHFENGRAYRMLGEATVERNSKRVSIEFKKLSTEFGEHVFDFKAQILDQTGIFGLQGEVHTGEGKFFLASLLSAAAAGFADSTIRRQTTAFGNQVDEQSLDTQSKKAAAGAMNKSAEHFSEKLKQTTEYVTLDGPVFAKVIVVEAPRAR